MAVLDDPKFWEWLRKKEQRKSDQEFEQIPLYISVEVPKPNKPPETDPTDTKIDYTVDGSVIFEF